MGATISYQHDPEQLQRVKDTERALLQHYGADEVVQEAWLDLPADSPNLAGVSKIRVLKVGPETGRLAIFIHGGGGMPVDWAMLMPLLAKNATMRYWFIERPGHGISEPFDYLKIKDNIDTHGAAFIDAVRKVSGEDKVDLVGNSMGGTYAYWYARSNPDRIRTFCWVGAPPFFKGQKLDFQYRLLGSWVGTQIMARPTPRSAIENLWFHLHQQQRDKVPEVFLEHYSALMGLRNTSLSFNSLLRAVFSNEKKYEFELRDLKEFPFPCFFIVGSNENLVTKEDLEVIQDVFGKPNTVIENGGHLPYLEDAPAVVEALQKAWA